jgi:hypothetical protein
MSLLPEREDSYEEVLRASACCGPEGTAPMTHGQSDVNVHPQNPIKMADEFVRGGISFEVATDRRQTHHFTDEALIHVFRKSLEHFVTYLRPPVDLV